MPARIRLALFALALAASAPPVVAQDKKDEKKDGAARKATVVANLKAAKLDGATVIETDNFVIATTLNEEKAKLLGAALEKVVPLARKALQYEEKDEAWKGKLAVYFLPSGGDFKNFVRTVLMKQPEGLHLDLRSAEPMLVDPVDVPAKTTEAEQFANTAAVIAGALLRGKSTSLVVPDWLAGGFGRVTAMRAEGTNSRRYQAYKTAARGVAGPKGSKLTNLWGDANPANPEVLANSVSEYLAYGPGAKEFTKLIYGFRPDENGNPPTPAQAFEAAGWKDLNMLDAAWRKWVQSGK